jgi:hypothetical protein
MLPRPDFDDEVRADIRYERGLAVEAVVSVALVVAVIVIQALFFG